MNAANAGGIHCFSVSVPADLQSAGAELGDLQSPMLTLALMLFHVSVAKIMVFIQLSKPFSRIANADIRCWRIANPPELGGLRNIL